MEAMRESWTDERLDDGFARVSADIQSLRKETGALRRELRQELRQEMNGLNGRFEHLDRRFDDLQRILIQVGGAMIVGLVGVIVAVLGVLATQL